MLYELELQNVKSASVLKEYLDNKTGQKKQFTNRPLTVQSHVQQSEDLGICFGFGLLFELKSIALV